MRGSTVSGRHGFISKVLKSNDCRPCVKGSSFISLVWVSETPTPLQNSRMTQIDDLADDFSRTDESEVN
jgi:hypothetical protein